MHAGRIRAALQILRRAENRLAESAADANSWSFVSCHGNEYLLDYTRRRFGGRQPLCGTGVTSLITVMSKPIACSARIAASRPLPGPFTHTSISFNPCAMPCRAASCATNCAAYAVLLREPLNPTRPALDQPIPALQIGDRHDRVVERRHDMGDALKDVLAVLGLDDLLGDFAFGQRLGRRRRNGRCCRRGRRSGSFRLAGAAASAAGAPPVWPFGDCASVSSFGSSDFFSASLAIVLLQT